MNDLQLANFNAAAENLRAYLAKINDGSDYDPLLQNLFIHMTKIMAEQIRLEGEK